MKRAYLIRRKGAAETTTVVFARCPLELLRRRGPQFVEHTWGEVEIARVCDGERLDEVSWKTYYVSIRRVFSGAVVAHG